MCPASCQNIDGVRDLTELALCELIEADQQHASAQRSQLPMHLDLSQTVTQALGRLHPTGYLLKQSPGLAELIAKAFAVQIETHIPPHGSRAHGATEMSGSLLADFV